VSYNDCDVAISAMRSLAVVPLLFAYTALSVPTSDSQIVIGDSSAYSSTFGDHLRDAVQHVVHDNQQSVSLESKGAEKWIDNFGRLMVEQSGLICESFPRPGLSYSNSSSYQTNLSPTPRSLSTN
jgi:hypothetical protein